MRAHHALLRCGLGLLAALLVCGWTLALAACASAGNTSAPPSAPYFSATDVSMDSPTDGWAVGRWIIPASAPYSAPTITPAMAHDQDGQWRLVPTSAAANLGPYEVFRLVRMLSPTDGWATTQGAIYHYDGVRWSLALPASASITLADLQMYSPNLGWAVGLDGILQYTHGAWVNVTASLPPPPADWEAQWPYPGLRSAAIASPTDVWAMGDGGMIWHYDGAHWRMAASPYFPNRLYTSPSVDGYTATDSLPHARLECWGSRVRRGIYQLGASGSRAVSKWERVAGGACCPPRHTAIQMASLLLPRADLNAGWLDWRRVGATNPDGQRRCASWRRQPNLCAPAAALPCRAVDVRLGADDRRDPPPGDARPGRRLGGVRWRAAALYQRTVAARECSARKLSVPRTIAEKRPACAPGANGDSPQTLDTVGVKCSVSPDNRRIGDQRLCYQQPIKGVTVVIGQRNERRRVLHRNWKNRYIVGGELLLE